MEIRGMLNRIRVILGAGLVCLLATAGLNLAQRPTPPAAPAAKPAAPASVGMPVESQQALIKQYCSGCHNEKLKSGGMSLTELDLAHIEKSPALTEKVIRKLRVGLMPPVGSPHPPAETMK